MDTKYLKRIIIYVLSAVASVLIIAYILYHLVGGFEIKTETLVSELVTRRESISMNGYIFRSEDLISSSISGDVSYLYSDGDRVSNGTTVANIYSTSSDDTKTKLLELDKKIAILEKSNLSASVITSNTIALDKQISQVYYEIRSCIESGNIAYAIEKQDDLLVLLNKRRIIVRDVTGYEDQINELKAEKEALLSQLSISESISVPCPGYFYSVADGYEDIFDSELVATLTIDGFNKIKSSAPSTSSSSVNQIGKLVTDHVWYIVGEIPKDQLRFFVAGNDYPVVFPYNSETEMSMNLFRVVTQNDSDNALLIFRTDVMPQNFNYLRMQIVNVIKGTYTGFRVPVSASRIVDGVHGVYTLRGNTVQFKRIDPLYEADGYFIVKEPDATDPYYKESLRLNDMIIIKGKNLYDGKVIN